MIALGTGCESLEIVKGFFQGATEVLYSLLSILTEGTGGYFQSLRISSVGSRLTLGATSCNLDPQPRSPVRQLLPLLAVFVS